MSNITPERKIAIAFIRVFRKNLDETLKPNKLPDVYGEAQANQAIKFLFGTLSAPPPELSKYLADLFEEMNEEFRVHMDKMYDELLPASITSAMSEIEKYLLQNFTQTEISELAVLAENETVMKLFSTSGVFGILRKERYNLYETMDSQILAYTTRPDVRERIGNAVQQFIGKRKLDDTHPDEDDNGSLDPNDIF